VEHKKKDVCIINYTQDQSWDFYLLFFLLFVFFFVWTGVELREFCLLQWNPLILMCSGHPCTPAIPASSPRCQLKEKSST
jgi:hypothetical protein